MAHFPRKQSARYFLARTRKRVWSKDCAFSFASHCNEKKALPCAGLDHCPDGPVLPCDITQTDKMLGDKMLAHSQHSSPEMSKKGMR